MNRWCAICSAELDLDNPAACCLECRLLAQAGFFNTEVWLPVIGHPGWQISDRGRIRDAATHQIREPDRSGKYPRISLNGRRRRVHILMAESWLGPRRFGMQVLHADDRPDNARISNISYGTPAQNAADAKRNRASAGDRPAKEGQP